MALIDGERLIARLQSLRGFGATGEGVVRPTFSEPDMAARRWLALRMAEAGLDTTIDGVGNVIGRSRRPGPALLVGSHSDTQPQGGWLDGAMGVVYGIEIASALGLDAATRDLAVDVASWSDEEGTYHGFLGSGSFCGWPIEDALDARAADGTRLGDAIRAAGLDGVPRARFEPGRHVGYLEAHIEQGGVLEATGQRIGVVTGIVGARGFDIAVEGRQNHAGTTPMDLRRDAGAAAIRVAHALQTTLAPVAGPHSVWTIGRMAFEPGAPSIIPGRATLHLQVRDLETARLDAMAAHVRATVAEADATGPCRVRILASHDGMVPATMDAGLQAHLAAAAERHAPGLWRRMPSGAGHDAQVLATRLPAAMLFVPSIGGVSHAFDEDTQHDDIVLGCRVLATAVIDILRAARD